MKEQIEKEMKTDYPYLLLIGYHNFPATHLWTNSSEQVSVAAIPPK